VYDKSPKRHTEAQLLATVWVDALGDVINAPYTSTIDYTHDVTGGILGKVKAAALIAAGGVPVQIVEACSTHACSAMAGRMAGVGTLVKLQKGYY
jgi:isopentenyl phosphate kinase